MVNIDDEVCIINHRICAFRGRTTVLLNGSTNDDLLRRESRRKFFLFSIRLIWRDLRAGMDAKRTIIVASPCIVPKSAFICR